MIFRFATRTSALARQQTLSVIQALQKAWPELEFSEHLITTRGDLELNRPLPEIGGKGLFTQELEEAILSTIVDAAVHSSKDLPVGDSPGLTIGAFPQRLEVRDVLISAAGHTLDTLPEGARVGTSSPRRTAQLLSVRPDLRIQLLRGNIDTRLHKAEEGLYDAIVLAGAGLIRLGKAEAATEWLSLERMLPAPGQGALAVQCRAEDRRFLDFLEPIDDLATRWTVEAERAFLAGLGGGCAIPVAAYAVLTVDGLILLKGLVASNDGRVVHRIEGLGSDPARLGTELAGEILTRGASQLLEK